VAATWAKFEFLVNEFIWLLANVGIREGACITAQIVSPIARFRALISLVGLRGGNQQLIKALNSFSAKADGIARQRNRVVHDPWMQDRNTKQFHRIEITADRKLNFEFAPVTVEDLTKLVGDINRLGLEFAKLREQIVAEVPPWPRTQYAPSRENHPVRTLSPDTEMTMPRSPPESSQE